MAFLSYFIACFSCSFRSFASSFILIFFFFFFSFAEKIFIALMLFILYFMMMIMMKRIMKIRLSRAEWEAFHISHERNSKRIFVHDKFFFLVLFFASLVLHVPPCWLANWLNKLYDQDMIELSSNNIKTLSFRHKALWSRFCIKDDDRKIHSYQRQRQQQRCETFFFAFAFVSKKFQNRLI